MHVKSGPRVGLWSGTCPIVSLKDALDYAEMGSLPASTIHPLTAAGAISAAHLGPRLLPDAQTALGAANRSPQFPKALPSGPGACDKGQAPKGNECRERVARVASAWGSGKGRQGHRVQKMSWEKKLYVERTGEVRSGSEGQQGQSWLCRAHREVQETCFPDTWCGRKLQKLHLWFVFWPADRVIPKALQGLLIHPD